MVKVIPEAEPYLKLNQDQIRAANKTNAYGGGGKIGWAPNLLATTSKPVDEPSPGKATKNLPKSKVLSPKKLPGKKVADKLNLRC